MCLAHATKTLIMHTTKWHHVIKHKHNGHIFWKHILSFYVCTVLYEVVCTITSLRVKMFPKCFSTGFVNFPQVIGVHCFSRLLWHLLDVLRCFPPGLHIPSQWSEETKQAVAAQFRFKKVTAALTQQGVHWPAVCICTVCRVENIAFEKNTLAVGRFLMRNSQDGGCCFPLI